MFIRRILYTVLLSITGLACCLAQADSVYISEIDITGNEKTRDFIIERELNVHGGQYVHPDELARMEERLLNTGLFSKAFARLIEDPNGSTRLHVDVQEGWYFFPSPSIKFADDDFSSWVDKGNMAIDRLSFGLKFYHLNLSGRGDYLKVEAGFGHQRNYGLAYKIPYINKARTMGVQINFSYSEYGEVAYTTVQDERLFLSTGSNDLFSKLELGLKTQFRPGLHKTHGFGVGFKRLGVSDSITDLNPLFFNRHSSNLKFFSLNYSYQNDKRNRRPISHSGYLLSINVKKEGIGIYNELNLGLVELGYEKYFPLSERVTAYLDPKARIYFIRNANPYYMNNALGEGGRYLRGYEEYAINGMDYVHASGGIRYLCFSNSLNFGKWMPSAKLRQMPFKVYLAGNIDAAKVWNPDFGSMNKLDNTLLTGYGPAVHLLLYETFHLSLEYNFNHRYESGLYLQTEFNL